MGRVVEEIERDIAAQCIGGAWSFERSEAGGFDVDTPLGLEQARDFTPEIAHRLQMLYDVHAGDRIEQSIGPRQSVRLKIGLREESPWWRPCWAARYIHGVELEIWPELPHVTQGLSVRRAEIEKLSALWRPVHERGARVNPGNKAPM